MLFQTTCSPKSGLIYLLPRLERGAKNDLNNYENETNQIHTMLDSDEYIAADAIYAGLKSKYNANILTSFLRHKENSNPFKKQWNNYFARYRTIVENLHSCYSKWAICSHVYRGTLEKLEKYWVSIAIITQMHLKENGGVRGSPNTWISN